LFEQCLEVLFLSVGKIQALLVFSIGFVRLENQMCLNVRWRSGVAYNVPRLAVRWGIRSTNLSASTNVNRKYKTSIKHFTPACGKPMLAACGSVFRLSVRSVVGKTVPTSFVEAGTVMKILLVYYQFFVGTVSVVVYAD